MHSQAGFIGFKSVNKSNYTLKLKFGMFKTMSSEMLELKNHIKAEEFKLKIKRIKLNVFGDPNSILEQDTDNFGVLFFGDVQIAPQPYVYRGHAGDPHGGAGDYKQIFNEGFSARGPNKDILLHVFPPEDSHVFAESNYVSTSLSKKIASHFPKELPPGSYSYLYEINYPKNALNVKKEISNNIIAGKGPNNDIPKHVKAEREISVPGKIEAKDIKGAWRVEVTGYCDYYRVVSADYIRNPSYAGSDYNLQQLFYAGKLVGRVFTGIAIATDTMSLFSAFQTSKRSGNYTNFFEESARITGGWIGAAAMGAAFAKAGAAGCAGAGPVGSAIGGAISGIVGSVMGYWSGSKLANEAYQTSHQANNQANCNVSPMIEDIINNESTDTHKMETIPPISLGSGDAQHSTDYSSNMRTSIRSNQAQSLSLGINEKSLYETALLNANLNDESDKQASTSEKKVKSTNEGPISVEFDYNGDRHALQVREGSMIHVGSDPVIASSCQNGRCDILLNAGPSSYASIRLSYNKNQLSQKQDEKSETSRLQNQLSILKESTQSSKVYSKEPNHLQNREQHLNVCRASGDERLQDCLARLQSNPLANNIPASVSNYGSNRFFGQSKNQNGAQNRATASLGSGNKQMQSAIQNLNNNIKALKKSKHSSDCQMTRYHCPNSTPLRQSKAGTIFVETSAKAQCLNAQWYGYLSGLCREKPHVNPYSGSGWFNESMCYAEDCNPSTDNCQGASTCPNTLI